jgi:hypothetical protein
MELPALTPALKFEVPAEAVIISAPSAKVTSAAKFTAPSTSTTSRLVVPSTSISPVTDVYLELLNLPTLRLAKASKKAAPAPAPSE